jgi:hypothetical protein
MKCNEKKSPLQLFNKIRDPAFSFGKWFMSQCMAGPRNKLRNRNTGKNLYVWQRLTRNRLQFLFTIAMILFSLLFKVVQVLRC